MFSNLILGLVEHPYIMSGLWRGRKEISVKVYIVTSTHGVILEKKIVKKKAL